MPSPGESDGRLASLVQSVQAILWEADATSLRFSFVSDHAATLLGYPPERWRTDPELWTHLVLPQDLPRTLEVLRAVATDGVARRLEHCLLAANGARVYLRTDVHRLADGTLGGLMVDVTADREARGRLERRLARLRASFDSTADGLLVVDLNDRIVATNQRFLELWGLTAEQLSTDSRARTAVLAQLSDPASFEERVRWLYGHPNQEDRDYLRLRDGRLLQRESRPQREEGRVVGRVWSFRDVTERERAEDALRASEERYRSLYNHTPVMMHSIDGEGRLLSVSDAWLEVLGYTREEVLGRASIDFLVPESQRRAREEVLPEFYRTGSCRDVPYVMVRKDGGFVHVLLSATSERYDGVHFDRSLAVLVDMSAHRRAERERDHSLVEAQEAQVETQEALALLDTLMMRAPVGLGFLDTQLRYVRVNTELARIHGTRVEDDLGRTISEVVPSAAGFAERALHQVMTTGEPLINAEVSLPLPGASELSRHYLASYYPVRTPGGSLLGVGVVVLDITEPKAAAETQARLYREAQEAIRVRDDFLTIASHELKTPLTPLAMYLQRLERHLREYDPARAPLVEKALRSTDRLVGLINDLLDASRIQAGRLALRRESLSLGALLREQLDGFQAMAGRHTLTLDAPESLTVDGDPARLAQVVSNLIDNALKYSPDGGPIEVRLWRKERFAFVSVSDRGIGVPEPERRMLFERFSRARNAPVTRYGGLGLGLYISRDIVERHGGRIWAEGREPGPGSSFVFCLPLLREDAGPL